MCDMSGSDPAIAGGRSVMAGEQNPTGGATSTKGKAVRVMAEVGGVRSSDDSVPDLWSGQPAEERRDATCSAVVKRSEGRGNGPQALQAPYKRSATAKHAGRRASAFRSRNSESRMRENRLSGFMRGGKQTVIGPRASQSVASRLLYTPVKVPRQIVKIRRSASLFKSH